MAGFGVKVYPSGKVQFILRYRSKERTQREYRIGQLGVIDAAEARRRARVLLGKISEGHDPVREQRHDRATANCFDDAIDRYLSWARENHKFTSFQEVSRYCRLHIRRHFGGIIISELTRGFVQQIYDRLKNAPQVRAKIITWSRAIWSWAEKRDLVGERRNPFIIDTRVQKPRRERILLPEEYKRLWQAVDKYRNVGTIPNVSLWVIEFLILSPLRKTEAFRLRWENVDLDGGVIRVEEHKTDREQGVLGVHISTPLADLLQRIPRCCDWVFPRPEAKTGHIMGVDKAWLVIRNEANLSTGRNRITLHDLRRSWNSVGAKLGYGPEAMGKVLGNSARVNETHYWHLTSDLKREIVFRVGDAIAGFKRGEEAKM